MSICTVDELRSALGVGSVYTDNTLQTVCDAADAVLSPMLWMNSYGNIAHSSTTTTGTLYFDFPTYNVFYVGQTVVVTGNGSKLNGSKTITGVGENSITFTITNGTAATYHPVQPYGNVACDTYTDWTTDAAVKQAALMISVDIWQSRNSANGGNVSLDGSPMPYRMGISMLSRVKGLIAHALAPGSLVG